MLKIDAILKYGQPSVQVLSYDQSGRPGRRMSPSPAMTSPTSRIQPSPPPKQTRIAAIVATDRRPVSWTPSAQTTRARTPANSALVSEVDADDVDAGHGRGDRAVEVGEPVVGQRRAGEVGDLRREVAGRDARADRDVDEEVAPVPAARHPAVGRLDPAVRCPGRARTTRPDGGRHDPGRRVRAKRAAMKPARVGRSSGASQRLRTSANADAARTRAGRPLTRIDARPNPPTRATRFTRWAET